MKFKDNAKALFQLTAENSKVGTGIDFFSWSDPAIDALTSIFCGAVFSELGLEKVSSTEEIVHLVYYYYLRRLADQGAVERLGALEREGLVEYCQAAILRSEEYMLNGRSVLSIDSIDRSEKPARVFLDVTNTATTKARTGIQRVVRELSRELGGEAVENISYIAFSRSVNKFKLMSLQDDEFVASEDLKEVFFNKGDIYFDVDGSWGDAVSRWSLYRQLKSAGIRIINIHYDAAPILFPMYSHPVTVLRYLEHFFAASIFSDKFVCISKAVERDYKNIASALQWRCAPTAVMPLGNVFSALNSIEEEIPSEVLEFSKNRFVLFVGTVEPRKNYSLLINNISRLEALGLRVIVIGKKGWESEEVIRELESAQEVGSVLWLQNAADGVLKFLYEKCYIYISVAHYEGYGLPVLEALSYGCAVVTSDGGALEEVGRGYTLSFRLADPDGLVKTIEYLVAHQESYDALKSNVANFNAPVWSDSTAKIHEILHGFLSANQQEIIWQDLQLVYISIRPESLHRSLTSFKKHGHIGEVVVLTSEEHRVEVEGVLAALGVAHCVMCDEDMFPEGGVPADHQERNFQLRKRLYNSLIIQDVFLSLDDDAILLKALPNTYYSELGKYNGYYYYSSMANWKSSPFGTTSYDEGQWRTSSLLLSHSYGDKSFSSHQPQIIDKSLVQEVYNEYSYNVAGGVDEWSLYFNVCLTRYSNCFSAKPVTTLNWPEDYSSWLPGWFLGDVHYMNYHAGHTSVEDSIVSVLKYSSAYDKYHAQRIIGSIAKPVMFTQGHDNMLAGFPDLWVDVKVNGLMSGVGYRIYSSDTEVVDGTADIQIVSYRAPLKIKLPAEPGQYRLKVFKVESGVELTSASVIVFPWRNALESI